MGPLSRADGTHLERRAGNCLPGLWKLDVDVASLFVAGGHSSEVVVAADRVAHALGPAGGFENLPVLVGIGVGKRSGSVEQA